MWCGLGACDRSTGGPRREDRRGRPDNPTVPSAPRGGVLLLVSASPASLSRFQQKATALYRLEARRRSTRSPAASPLPACALVGALRYRRSANPTAAPARVG